MADEFNDGGPAYPNWDVGPVGADGVDGTVPVPGMSLRDHFAGQALAGIGTWIPEHGGVNLGTKQAMQARALWAYEQADAMIAARSR